jgi:NitT/TauT family transport system substrate-binding protein
MSAPVSRRATLAALGATAAAAALPRPGRAQSAPMRAGLIPIWDVAPYYAAVQQGYFTAENIATTAQTIRGGAAAIPALVGDTFDIIYSNGTSIATAIARGIDLRIVIEGAPVGNAPPDPGALLKREGDPFHTGKDLEGKVIAVNALRDVQWMFVQTWVKATGGDPANVQIIEVGLPAMVPALKEKRVDAALALDPFMTIGLADPEIELLDWPLSRVYAGGPVGFFAVTPELTQTRPNDIRAFVRAYKRGVAWLNANQDKDAYVALIAAFTGMNPDLVRRIKPPPAHAEIIPGGLSRLTTMMSQTGILPAPVDLRTKIFS